jgi:hypothetical protein
VNSLRNSLRLSHDGGPLLFFAGVALLLMAPLWGRWNTHFYGPFWDNTEYIYMAGWMARALASGQSPFFDPRLNFPDGLMVTATDVPYVHLLIATPLAAGFGPLVAYNSIVLLCHFLTGAVTYLWVQRHTGSRFGGIIAGLAFLMSPYREFHLTGGHLNLVAMHVMPLYFWMLDRALQPLRDNNELSWRRVAILVLTTFYVGSTSQYYLAICMLSGIVYTITYLGSRFKRNALNGVKVFSAALVGGALSSLPYLSLVRSRTFEPSAVEMARAYSASPLDFVTPAATHPFWQHLAGGALGTETTEQTIYIGIVALLLAFWFLRHPAPHQSTFKRASQRAWWVVALFAVVLALGTDLQFANRDINPENPLYLPAYFLGQLPFASILRVWARFGIIAILFVALLAGCGAAKLIHEITPAKRRWAMLVLGTLLLLDTPPLFPITTRLEARPIDRWLQAQPGQFAVAFLPPPVEVVHVYRHILASLEHNKSLPATVHPRHQPPAYRRFRQAGADFPAPRSLQALRRFGFRYLILDTSLFDGENARRWQEVELLIRQNTQLRVVSQLGQFVVLTWR